MPINAYTGLMGSGKSYEVVSSVIVLAVRHGRRVVTNVDSINSDLIRAYCHEEFDVPLDKLGSVVHCSNDLVGLANFLPHGNDEVETFCKPGDLVCIDEAWRFWGTDCKLLPEHKIFFREHRHYVDPVTHVSCDLVLMVQDIGDLNRVLKVVVELTFKTHKKKTLGLNKIYSLQMYEGYKLNSKTLVDTFVKKYNPKIFPLYASYSGGQGKEKTVDNRQNILSNPALMIKAGLMIVFMLAGFGYLWWFFHSSAMGKSGKNPEASAAFASSSVPLANQTANPSPSIPKRPKPEFSETWRIVGQYQLDDQLSAVVADREGRLRVVSYSMISNSGALMIGDIDGEIATRFSGSAAGLLGDK